MVKTLKSLNIDNTFRNKNYNASLRYGVNEEIIKVNRLNEDYIWQLIHTHDFSNKRFILFNGKYENNKLNNALLRAKVPVSYFTTSKIPYGVMKGMQGNNKAEAVYQVHSQFELDELNNMELAGQLCRTVVNVPVIYPDTSPKKLLLALYDARYLINRVDLNFVTLSKAEINQNDRKDFYEYSHEDRRYHLKISQREDYYHYLHEFLARWVMRLNMVNESGEYLTKLNESLRL